MRVIAMVCVLTGRFEQASASRHVSANAVRSYACTYGATQRRIVCKFMSLNPEAEEQELELESWPSMDKSAPAPAPAPATSVGGCSANIMKHKRSKISNEPNDEEWPQTNKQITTNKTYPKPTSQKNTKENPQTKQETKPLNETPKRNPQTKHPNQTPRCKQAHKQATQKNPGDQVATRKTFPPLKAQAPGSPPMRETSSSDSDIRCRGPAPPSLSSHYPQRGFHVGPTKPPFTCLPRASAFLSFCASVSQDCPCAVVVIVSL